MIPQSIHEQNNKYLATVSIDNAVVKALQTHGFVFLPGLFRHSTEHIGMIEE